MLVYLTQKIGEGMLWNITINNAGVEYDPLTLLRSRTMFGRPDWKSQPFLPMSGLLIFTRPFALLYHAIGTLDSAAGEIPTGGLVVIITASFEGQLHCSS